jgi:hypothetical protein
MNSRFADLLTESTELSDMKLECVKAVPGPNMLYTLQRTEKLYDLFLSVKIELSRLARFGINYLVVKCYNLAVAHSLRSMLGREGYIVVSLPGRIVEGERLFVTYNIIENSSKDGSV